MTIGELAKKSGVSVDTLRYYERIGVLPRAPRRGSGIRDYGEDFISWLELVGVLKSSGLSLEAIVEYMDLAREGSGTVRERRAIIESSRALLEAKIIALQSAAAEAAYQLKHYEKVLLPKTQRLMAHYAGEGQVAV